MLVRITRKLRTTNELVARRLVDECAALRCDLHEHPARSQQAAKHGKDVFGPTFEQAAEQLLKDSKVANHPALLALLKLHAFKHIGTTPVRAVTTEDIEAVMVHARDVGREDGKPLQRYSIKNIREGIGIVLAHFYPDALVSVLATVARFGSRQRPPRSCPRSIAR